LSAEARVVSTTGTPRNGNTPLQVSGSLGRTERIIAIQTKVIGRVQAEDRGQNTAEVSSSRGNERWEQEGRRRVVLPINDAGVVRPEVAEDYATAVDRIREQRAGKQKRQGARHGEAQPRQ
jgi:hypothetical protein